MQCIVTPKLNTTEYQVLLLVYLNKKGSFPDWINKFYTVQERM